MPLADLLALLKRCDETPEIREAADRLTLAAKHGCYVGYAGQKESDWHLLADAFVALRNALPELIAELERLEKENAHLRDVATAWRGEP